MREIRAGSYSGVIYRKRKEVTYLEFRERNGEGRILVCGELSRPFA